MACMVCRAANDPKDERCVRCGRRLHLASPRSAPLEFQPNLDAVQTAFFREPGQTAKIIPIPTLTPYHPQPEGEARRGRRATTPPRSRRPDNQQLLAFPDATPQAAAAFTPDDESIVCDAPVAPKAQRMLAAGLDAGTVSVSLLGVAFGLWAVGGLTMVAQLTLPWMACTVAAVSLFYRCVWSIAGRDTPGMRFAGLRLVDFDGRTPNRDQRSIRQVAGILSVASAGLGILWALADEESLTWHDRISKTFPTGT